MKKLLFFATAALIMAACSNSGNKTQSVEPAIRNEIVIINDLENSKGIIPSWFNENTVVVPKETAAHSGEYACVTNDTIQYSYTYKEFFRNIDNRLPKLVTYSGWIYTTLANPNISIICNINENNQQYNWKAFPLDKNLTETRKWVEFTTSFYFDDKPINAGQELALYAWNQSKKPVYIDDLKITFSY